MTPASLNRGDIFRLSLDGLSSSTRDIGHNPAAIGEPSRREMPFDVLGGASETGQHRAHFPALLATTLQGSEMALHVQGIPTADYERLRNGGTDAYGQPPVLRITKGPANPCRHYLGLINEGEPKLVLAYQPFAAAQPYAETGPIFLHQGTCARYDSDALPAWFAFLDPAAIRGYGADDWIRYDTAQIVRGSELAGSCTSILSDASIAYAHVRSKYGCFQCRVDRA